MQQVEKKQEYRVLARKYRPQRLADLKGQEILCSAIEKAIAESRVPHAFLFHGIRGVGKTTTARILAKSLNCKGADGKGEVTSEPCGVCTSCVSVQEDRHLDVIEIDAASHTGVDDMREIVDACRYKAVQGRYKVFIIDEVHMLSKSAFNALLKTLEEPPAHVKFIFATTEIRKIPDTILSRCQRFDLKRMDQNLLIDYLGEIAKKEGFSAEKLALSVLARAADGSMRDGLSLLDQAISLTQIDDGKEIKADLVRDMLGQADRGMIIDLMEALFSGKVENGLHVVRKIIETGVDNLLLLQDVLAFVYALTSYKTQKAQTDLGFSKEEHERFITLAESLSPSVLLQSWQVLIKGYEELVKSPLQDETLEMVLIRLCYVLPFSSIGSIQKTTDSNDLESKKKITSFHQLLDTLKDEKEMTLHTHCRHDVQVVSFASQKILMKLNTNVYKKFLPDLKDFLMRYTGQEWFIERVFEGEGLSVVEKEQIALKKLEDEIKEQPIAKRLLEAFPDSIVSFEHH